MSQEMLEEKISNHEIMYGITTGIGEFSEVTLDPDQTKEFQKLLIYSHAAGIGKPVMQALLSEGMQDVCDLSYLHDQDFTKLGLGLVHIRRLQALLAGRCGNEKAAGAAVHKVSGIEKVRSFSCIPNLDPNPKADTPQFQFHPKFRPKS